MKKIMWLALFFHNHCRYSTCSMCLLLLLVALHTTVFSEPKQLVLGQPFTIECRFSRGCSSLSLLIWHKDNLKCSVRRDWSGDYSVKYHDKKFRNRFTIANPKASYDGSRKIYSLKLIYKLAVRQDASLYLCTCRKTRPFLEERRIEVGSQPNPAHLKVAFADGSGGPQVDCFTELPNSTTSKSASSTTLKLLRNDQPFGWLSETVGNRLQIKMPLAAALFPLEREKFVCIAKNIFGEQNATVILNTRGEI